MNKNIFFIIISLILFNINNVNALELTKSAQRVSVDLITNYNEINLKQKLEMIVKFRLHDGWHIYGQKPGDIGLPTTVNVQLPIGYIQVDEKWSLAKRFMTEGIESFGYGRTAFFKTTITPTENNFSIQNFDVNVSWLACKDECINENVKFSFTMPTTPRDLLPNQTWKIEDKQANISFNHQGGEENIFFIMIMAFLGGIILNFMPCIFPILTIKAISLAQGTYNRKKAQIEAMLYTIGVVVSFLIIATILVFLRSQGEEIGWGFQLQSPIFVSIMIVVFIVILLMLLDIVNLNNPFANKIGRISFKRKKINAFVTGFFAVIIASPCTAPFMGIAIGYTLTSPIYIYYPVFIALSLGYALPFALIGTFPKLIHKILPRPGRWMDLLKKVFALPILLTIIWLSWVLYNQLHMTNSKNIGEIKWNEYKAEEVQTLVKNGQPVFIDFTAKWCITCLMNKQVALQSNDFAKLIKSKNITLFRADWTNKSEKISHALETYGRNSIPLYVYYDGKSSEYVILPQLLTPKIIQQNLK